MYTLRIITIVLKLIRWSKINLKAFLCTSKPICSRRFSTNDVAKKPKQVKVKRKLYD